jgi:DNA polymerase/3'-5' exonuclease PolX
MNSFIDKFNKKNNTNINIYTAGSYRLGKSNSKDIDLILSIQKKEKQNLEIIFKNIINTLIHDDILFDYVNISKNQIFGIIKVNNVFRHIDLRLIDEKYLPYYQLYFGSGEQFSRLIRQFAKDKGFKLTNKEFLDIRKNKKIKVKSEQDIFKKLGLNYVEPENRPSTLSL